LFEKLRFLAVGRLQQVAGFHRKWLRKDPRRESNTGVYSVQLRKHLTGR